ncbi:MAG: ABC transporter permease [Candidatus Acetothermia bacterium]
MFDSQLLKKIAKNNNAVFGVSVILFTLVVAIFAPYIAPHQPNEQDLLNRLNPPSLKHPLGTDGHGRDILSRVIFGSRISLLIGLISIGIGLGIGVPMGLTAGFLGGAYEEFIMRTIDIMMSFPGILLALVVVAILGPGLFNVMIAIGIWSIPIFTRIVRGSTLSLREEQFIEAARALGVGDFKIMVKHVLPNCLAPILVLSSLRLATAILSAAALSFLGLGAQPPTPDWGAMLSAGRDFLREAWWFSTFPGLAIMFVVLGFNLLGDGLRDVLDPKMRGNIR